MGWHYQAVRRRTPNGDDWIEVREAYPDLREDDGPLPITEGTCKVDGETVDDIRWALKAMLNDLDRHGVIDAETGKPQAQW